MQEDQLILGFWFVDAWTEVPRPDGSAPWFVDMWEKEEE